MPLVFRLIVSKEALTQQAGESKQDLDLRNNICKTHQPLAFEPRFWKNIPRKKGKDFTRRQNLADQCVGR